MSILYVFCKLTNIADSRTFCFCTSTTDPIYIQIYTKNTFEFICTKRHFVLENYEALRRYRIDCNSLESQEYEINLY